MLIKRSILSQLEAHMYRPEITMITGARQVGKTTIMNILREKLHAEDHKTLFFNLDYEKDYKYFSSQEVLLQKINLESGNDRIFVFIDELQRKENAGVFLKGIYDGAKHIKFIVSGSGSLELKENIHESLVGRKRVFELLPVSFEEFVDFRTGYRYQQNLKAYFDIEHEELLNFLHEYLTYGGYPAVVTENKKEEKYLLMNEIFSSYIQKDLSYLLNLDRPESFVKLIEWLSHTAGTGINYSTCSADIGLSLPTVKKYLWYAEHTFIIKSLTPFYSNKRKEISKSPVVYFFDLGMKNFAFGNFGAELSQLNAGQLFENFIFSILYQRVKNTNYRLHYWRTTDMAEVDFVITKGPDIIPVEVKFTHLDKDRFGRAFLSFITKYQPKTAYIVNVSARFSKTVDGTTIYVIPFYDLFYISLAGQ